MRVCMPLRAVRELRRRERGAGRRTSRTSRFCMYRSLIFSHDEMQFEMYK